MLEINSYPDRFDLKDSLIREVIRYNVQLIINTDSRSIGYLSNMRYGVNWAKRGWCEIKNIISILY